ncbi:MAG: SOS response-associated peptidase [Bacteroidia bacterium]|nr:SOS response-associated peptidase [Bacteroidia bacterium]
MCFHYSLKKKERKINLNVTDLFSQMEMNFETVYHANGFKNPIMPVITNPNQNAFQFFNWGLIPSWIKLRQDAEKIRQMTLNAKSETVFEKPSFRKSIKTRRCLIPATGFFEWYTFNNKKYPFYICLNDEDVFMFAGIWDTWTDNITGEIINTFSIINTEANPLLRKIHNIKQRMPVILSPEAEHLWLSNNLEQDEIKTFLKPYNDNWMKAYTIDKKISSRHENTNVESILTPVKYPEL